MDDLSMMNGSLDYVFVGIYMFLLVKHSKFLYLIRYLYKFSEDICL